MAYDAKPFFQIATGGTGITTRDVKTELTLGEKMETNLNIIDTDSFVPVSYSLISSIKFMSFRSTDEFNVKIDTATGSLTFAIDKEFAFTPTVAFLATVTSISLSTSSTTAITVNIQIIGGTIV